MKKGSAFNSNKAVGQKKTHDKQTQKHTEKNHRVYNRLLISKSHEQNKEGTVMRPDLALRLASYLR